MIIGITGGSGCGKTTALEAIRDRGGLVLDCDQIYHELLKTDCALLSDIEAAFPGTVKDGVLDREALGALVFGDKKALKKLNALTHPAVVREVERQLQEKTPALVGIDAIGLLDSGLKALCDVTVAVIAPRKARLLRIMARDGLDEAAAAARIDAQPSNRSFAARCDVTLKNDGSPTLFQRRCEALLNALLKEKL